MVGRKERQADEVTEKRKEDRKIEGRKERKKEGRQARCINLLTCNATNLSAQQISLIPREDRIAQHRRI